MFEFAKILTFFRMDKYIFGIKAKPLPEVALAGAFGGG
jgi:hypothetical protein